MAREASLSVKSYSVRCVDPAHCIMAEAAWRVPGLTIRDCARGCNNREHTRTQLSAIDVTAKVFFERLYLVLGLSPFEPRVNCAYAPTPPPLAHQLFFDFRAIIF